MAAVPCQNVDSGPGVKVCPLCAELIKAAAKVCPFCRASQTRWAHWGPSLGVGFSVLTMLALVGLVCVWAFPDILHLEGRDFAPHRAELAVARTSLERDPTKPGLWLNGYVTNSGTYPWRVLELEVRLMELEGKLADVRQPRISDPFVVQPHQERAFRVGLDRVRFTNLNASAKVRVLAASDANHPPKNE